ncbi:unnamed protein product [marine sediment metagenome]|uniref:Uncharacterized protein n=1 Tax=marine sediment metagenome TaxID=412755 RepID=X1LHU1_9ZZZZ
MSKRKYPSELNSRTIRVNIGDWQWLNSLSQRLGITVAQAFHKVITGLDHKEPEPEPEPKPEPAQIPMIPVSFEPKFIEINGAAAFKPKSISGNGIAHIKVKSIEEV